MDTEMVHANDTPLIKELDVYVCPVCKCRLSRQEAALVCRVCSNAYPIIGEIPDFIREELSRSADPVLRRMRFIDRMASIYESKLWYPLVLTVYGGLGSPTLPQLIEKVTQRF